MDWLKSQFSGLWEKLSEQAFAQEIKAKWEELPSEQRHIARLGGLFGSVLLLAIIMVSWWASVNSLEREVQNKTRVLAIIENGTQELAQLKSSLVPGANAGSEETPWVDYIKTTAAQSGVDPESLQVGEPQAGEDTEITSESLIDLNLKRTNVRKLSRLVFALENGGRPVKLRNIVVDTKEDTEGYLDVTLSVSAFRIK